MLTKAPRGTSDLYGSAMEAWQGLEEKIRIQCAAYGFKEIRTPVFEHTELFQRGVGETTDIVQKEMYTFQDKKGRSLTLKPEGTAGVVRAYLEQKMYADTQPTKLFYFTPAFRYEKPQAGRMRQFHQFGVELFGSGEPAADAEVIALASQMLDRLGIRNVELQVNSLGGGACRQNYNRMLEGFLQEHREGLCETCRERMERNPLRVLDCKVPSCQEVMKDAPLIIDNLGPECREHFEKTLGLLDAMGIPYAVNPWIVRGLDYYTKTVFEFVSKEIGAQGTVCGGGRYDNLIQECGGDPTPAVGFGAGIERLLMTMEKSGAITHKAPGVDLYIAHMGPQAQAKAFALAQSLRGQDHHVETDLLGKSVKAQMKQANRLGARRSMVVGDTELAQGAAQVKDMETGAQETVAFDGLANYLMRQKSIEPGGN
ncbi:histidine--tRNA ligase [Anaerotalea alkaliphila]|uniref:Histidine--tRNA ligase n=1 Tax=Anaerotalea alkaliphila TaxID=2662126 RepID=A0A7X5KNB2_9FIRM|nr:histidine--tRNA ligase [Anaerotalea alkaliphila]NDL67608.1 histidine--tRNA ligase [Anaerotalea alkaliphila]